MFRTHGSKNRYPETRAGLSRSELRKTMAAPSSPKFVCSRPNRAAAIQAAGVPNGLALKRTYRAEDCLHVRSERSASEVPCSRSGSWSTLRAVLVTVSLTRRMAHMARWELEKAWERPNRPLLDVAAEDRSQL